MSTSDCIARLMLDNVQTFAPRLLGVTILYGFHTSGNFSGNAPSGVAVTATATTNRMACDNGSIRGQPRIGIPIRP